MEHYLDFAVNIDAAEPTYIILPKSLIDGF